MEDELMFSMEEEASATRTPLQQKTPSQRNASQSGGPASDDDDDDDDDDEDFIIYPILSEPKKEIVNYLQNLVHNKQLSTSLPKNEFVYKAAWKHAIAKAKAMPDPWAEFHLEEKETELCTRYRFNAVKGEWAQDQVYIKMAAQPFGRGAMRECFRTKKLSNFSHSSNWKSAANYVAKCYMQPVERDVYFEDVRLQMEAKLWGEEFNRHRPPKQVDIMQMCVVEITSRPGKPVFHLEHYIEGKYIKYNSNSGFVRDDNIRLTPQAFSHFTFERSGHQLIVVDIQGVGDLYTDPQVHTEKGDDYGDGNLGLRGMALFFHSHLCNKICKGMDLTPFDHSSAEKSQLDGTSKLLKSAQTVLRGCEEQCGSPRVRTFSGCRAPPLLSRLSETSSADDNMSDGGDSVPCSPHFMPCSPMAIPSSMGRYPVAFTSMSFNSSDDQERYGNSNTTDNQESESGGDSGYPSERRSDGDQHDIVDGAHRRVQRYYSESDEDSVKRRKMVVSRSLSASSYVGTPLMESVTTCMHDPLMTGAARPMHCEV
ncbi:hypothetical protein NHX12_025002 [Muraenolepis orangiensis]|uniref:Eukaryotic elongation factor 2 kinase n=1 Tax=Muraenolepis orangiensis TaxID=630683 RepID=A0A9Q0ELC4_9TELE|nr:hypothetical protein NHX12_025002 [Muraenolepis orangiensis]